MEQKDKKIEKVVTGEARLKKKSGFVLFMNRFGVVPEDIEDVKFYIIREIIIPAIKDLAIDSFTTLIKGGPNHGDYKRSGSRTSYERYWNDRGNSDRKESKGKTRNISYNEVVFDSKGDAQYTLDTLIDWFRRYGTVSIADLYEAAGIDSFPHTYERYGWNDFRDLEDARVSRSSDGYIIKIVRPYPID